MKEIKDEFTLAYFINSNAIDENNKSISESLASIVTLNSEKLTKLDNLSNEIKNSAIEG